MSRLNIFALMAVACVTPDALLAQTSGAITAATEPSDSLTEVVVTAQRRSERLQDVPLTVTAVSGETLAAAGVTNIQDLNLVVPGLSVNNEVGFAIAHLRGVGSTAIGPGIENPVAVYVDGVYYASAQSSLFDFLNVQNVEVLKGPQGTLFGRNATGGLIQITTIEPTQSTRIDADIGFANYQTGKADLYVSGGITTNLAADVALQVGGAGEGYGRNFYNGSEVYRNDLAFNSRSKWVWTPSDVTKITAAFDFSKTHNSEAPQPVVPGASNLAALAAYPVTYGSVYNINQNEQPLTENQSGGASVRLDQQFSVFNLMDIVAFRRANSQTNFDLDNTPSSTENIFAHSDDNQLSEEIQLSSRPSSVVRWTAGLYYFHSGGQYDPAIASFGQLYFYPAPPAVYPFATVVTTGDQTASSYAGYGQATFPLGADTNLTTGVRYTDETHSLRGGIAFFDPTGAPIAPLNATYPSVSDTFKAPTYRIALDHHITSDLLVYASWNTGFKSGGYNTQFYTDGPFQPEKLFAYEVGAKSEFLDRKVRVNVAAFHDKYKNIQVQYVHGAGPSIINGAGATLYGVDLDAAAQITTAFSITASAEYLHARYDSFDSSPCSNPDLAITEPTFGCNVSGHTMPYAPQEQFTVAGDYTIPLTTGAIDLNATVNHSAGYFPEPDNVITQPRYTKVNASTEWKSSSGRYAVQLWGRNLTNENTFAFATTIGSGLHEATYDPPRTYGITFGYHYR